MTDPCTSSGNRQSSRTVHRLMALTLTSAAAQVDNFPYPTAPQAAGLREAQQCLVALGAMDPETGALTELGRALSGYPISPRHARMILEVWGQVQHKRLLVRERACKGLWAILAMLHAADAEYGQAASHESSLRTYPCHLWLTQMTFLASRAFMRAIPCRSRPTGSWSRRCCRTLSHWLPQPLQRRRSSAWTASR